MSAFLPSPTTAYQGGADPARVAWLRRGEIMGSGVALSIAAAVSLVAADEMGAAAGLVFLGAAVILGLFLLEYERAIRLGQKDGMGVKGAGY
jgi:hypothetical protein